MLQFYGEVKDNKTGFINSNGVFIIPIQWENAFPFQKGYAAVKRDGKWGFIDKTGNVVSDFTYDEVRPYNDGNIEGRINDKWQKIRPHQFGQPKH